METSPESPVTFPGVGGANLGLISASPLGQKSSRLTSLTAELISDSRSLSSPHERHDPTNFR
jgi:hypothetical protein